MRSGTAEKVKISVPVLPRGLSSSNNDLMDHALFIEHSHAGGGGKSPYCVHNAGRRALAKMS